MVSSSRFGNKGSCGINVTGFAVLLDAVYSNRNASSGIRDGASSPGIAGSALLDGGVGLTRSELLDCSVLDFTKSCP